MTAPAAPRGCRLRRVHALCGCGYWLVGGAGPRLCLFRRLRRPGNHSPPPLPTVLPIVHHSVASIRPITALLRCVRCLLRPKLPTPARARARAPSRAARGALYRQARALQSGARQVTAPGSEPGNAAAFECAPALAPRCVRAAMLWDYARLLPADREVAAAGVGLRCEVRVSSRRRLPLPLLLQALPGFPVSVAGEHSSLRPLSLSLSLNHFTFRCTTPQTSAGTRRRASCARWSSRIVRARPVT